MGSALTKPILVQPIERCGNLFFRCGCATVNGMRGSNEDAHLMLVRSDGACFAVFDGHTGAEAAEAARNAFAISLKSTPIESLQSEQSVTDFAARVDDAVLAEIGDDSASGTTGTFVFATLVDDAQEMRSPSQRQGDDGEVWLQLIVGNVGDSRVLLSTLLPSSPPSTSGSNPWTMMPMTRDHKPEDPDERSRIERFGGKVEKGRVDGNLAVSRAFGDRYFKTNANAANSLEQKVIAVPDVTTATVPWNKGAFAVLCCDGVFESNFSNEQVIEFIRNQLTQTKDLAVIAGRVCHEAVARGSKDNVTCMIVEFADGSDLPVEPAVEALHGPFSLPRHALFRELYAKSACLGQTPVEVLLERRYDEIIAKQTRPLEVTKDGDEAKSLLDPDEVYELEHGFLIRRALRNRSAKLHQHHHHPSTASPTSHEAGGGVEIEAEDFFDDDDDDEPPAERGSQERLEWFRRLFLFLSTLKNDDDHPSTRPEVSKAAAPPRSVIAKEADSSVVTSGLTASQHRIFDSFMEMMPDVPQKRAREVLEKAQWDVSTAIDSLP